MEYPNTLTKALPLTRDIDVIIRGHGGGLAKPQDLEVHRDFMRDFLEAHGRRRRPAKARRLRPRRGNCQHGTSDTRRNPLGYWGP